MTRARFIDQGTTAGGGGPGGGGDIVFLGPDYGEPVDLTVGAAVAFKDLNLGPFATPQVGAAATFGLLNLGAFATPQVGARVTLPSLGLGPFARHTVGAAVAGRVVATGIRPSGDTWLDQANPSTTHGSDDTLEAKVSTVAGSNARRGYIAWDLTGWAGTTITSATLSIAVQTNAATDANAPWEFRTAASQPFVESTATWGNSVPVGGTVRQSGTVLAPGTLTGGWAVRTISLDATARANIPGNWCWLRLAGADGLGVSIIRIRSKEHATSAEQPFLDLAATL